MTELTHITQCDDPKYLPFARSRIKALRATGLKYGSQQFEVDGVQVKVRIEGEHSFVSIVGGALKYVFNIGDTTSFAISTSPNLKEASPKPKEAGYNFWSDGKRVVTYNSGCRLRHRVRRYIPALDLGNTLETPYEGVDKKLWINGTEVKTPFVVAAAAIFKGVRVALEVRSSEGSAVYAYTGILAKNTVNVHAFVEGTWKLVGTHSVSGTTLKAPQNLGQIGPALTSKDFSTTVEDKAAVLDDPIHFHKDGSKFITLVTPVTTEASAFGPIDGFATESFVLEGKLSFDKDAAPDDAVSVSFITHPVIPRDFNPSPGQTYTPYPESELTATGLWVVDREGGGSEVVYGSINDEASASGVMGVDYGDDGEILILTIHHSYKLQTGFGTLAYNSNSGLIDESKIVLKRNGTTFVDEFVGTRVTSDLVSTYLAERYREGPPEGYILHYEESSRNGTTKSVDLCVSVMYLDIRTRCFAALSIEYGKTDTFSGSQKSWITYSGVPVQRDGIVIVSDIVALATPVCYFGGQQVARETPFDFETDTLANELGKTIRPLRTGKPLGASVRKNEAVMVVEYPGSNIPNYLWVVLKGGLRASPRTKLKPAHLNTRLFDIRCSP